MTEQIRLLTITEIHLHNKAEDCWVIRQGKVYDVTKFLGEHPGGEKAIANMAGKDITSIFEVIGHGDDAAAHLETFCIGHAFAGRTDAEIIAEVAKHNTESDCWIIFEGDIFDVSKFLDEHPGGREAILSNAGKDVTEIFKSVGHSEGAKEALKKFHIDKLPSPKPIIHPTHPTPKAEAKPESAAEKKSSTCIIQ